MEKYYQLEDALALKSPEQVEKYWAAIKDPTVRQHYNEIIASRVRGSVNMTQDYMEFRAGVVAAEAHDFEKAIKHYENAIVYNKKNPE